MASAPIALRHPLAPEDRARANFYAILAALFADAPSAQLLATVGATDLLEDAEAAGELRALLRLEFDGVDRGAERDGARHRRCHRIGRPERRRAPNGPGPPDARGDQRKDGCGKPEPTTASERRSRPGGGRRARDQRLAQSLLEPGARSYDHVGVKKHREWVVRRVGSQVRGDARRDAIRRRPDRPHPHRAIHPRRISRW